MITRLSIGEFSKICKVSTKTLRYHDEIGLIHPEDINPEMDIGGSIRKVREFLIRSLLQGERH
ncbi:hypothetical protein ABA10_01205 [Bacillus subtilis]|nr:transcriptional regulator [Bacillus subtilis subsp. subtilis str. BAB-1]AKI90670.1 hypothetical protein ABA10_01205 [Bacillus subtilis]ALS83602.1 hypothetical protein AT706_17355 [Bacillus subtilis subsp. subtilis]ASK22179.1 transcriptional regulator [Bacillus subtilis]